MVAFFRRRKEGKDIPREQKPRIMSREDECLVDAFSMLLTLWGLNTGVAGLYLEGGNTATEHLRGLLQKKRQITADERERMMLLVSIHCQLDLLSKKQGVRINSRSWLNERITKEFPEYAGYPILEFLIQRGFAGMRVIAAEVEQL